MATANELVGSVYEVGIEGTGYMLADSPQRPVRRSTGLLDSQPPGSDAPLSERIGRYDFVGSSDWTGGEGQEMADRPSSDVTRYFYSEGLDGFSTPGQITCLPVFPLQVSDTYSEPQVVSVWAGAIAGSLFVRTADAELTMVDGTGAPTAFNPGLAGTPVSGGRHLASDGTYWYITDGASIRRNNAAADPAANWATEDVTQINWCSDRIMGLDTVASPPELISFSPTGTGTVIATHTGATLQGVCGGDGYVWYGVNYGVGGASQVRYWQVDSSPTNLGTAFSLPTGEQVTDLIFYLGNVFVMTRHVVQLVNYQHGKIYRCVPSDGTLTPQLVVDELPREAHGMAGIDRFVAFGWTTMHTGGQAGIGIIDLETGGYARWHVGTSTSVSAQVFPTTWLEDVAFAIGGEGLYGRDASDVSSPTYRTGFFETSTSDLATPARKHLDEILLSTLPLPAGTSVAVAYSIDNGATYTTAATFNTTGDTQHSVELATAVVAASFRFKVTLTPSSSVKPTVTALLAKTHTTGIIDQIIELPINCEDYIADVNNTTIAVDSGPGKGMERYRALEVLLGTKVLYQDVDWKVTQTTSLCEVVGVESTQVNVFNQGRNLNDQTAHVAVVQLRRPYTA